MAKQRIDKLLSHQGFGTRKDIKKLLRQADVFLNGKQIYDPSITIDPQTDVLTIDDEQIDFTEHYYIMMNKVAHTVSSNKDGEHQTVFDLLDESFHTPYLEEKLHLVGRLDMDTEGLLLFTTDGELTHKLISPKSNINKTYFCVLEKSESEDHKKQIEELFLQGIEVGPEDNEPGFKCQSATVKWATSDQIQKWLDKSTYPKEKVLENTTVALLTISEGKYHQVKRMFQAVQNKVVYLKRLSIGRLQLDTTLKPGEYKLLSDDDVEKLFL